MDAVAAYLQELIRELGYPGLFLLIVLESTAVPVPSLLVMPFAGFLASEGYFSLGAILVLNTLGALVGSGLSYWFGAAGGKPLLLRWGRYLFVRPADIARTEAYFARHGARTILVARFLPVVRHLISIPAGIARMPLTPFLSLTALGASAWGGGLMVLGYQLGQNWEGVVRTWKKFDLVIGLAVVAVLVLAAVRFVRQRRRRAAGAPPEASPGAGGSDPGSAP
jgi:membrane protein DedA with SNARE-associated domain